MDLNEKIKETEIVAERIKGETWDDVMLKVVFTPIFTELVAVDLLTKSLDAMAENRVSEVKKRSRETRKLIEDIKSTWRNEMMGSLWESVKEQVAEYQHGIVNDLFLHQQVYVRETMNSNKTMYDIDVAVATMMMVKDICREVIEYDKDAEKVKDEIAKKLGRQRASSGNDSWISKTIIKQVDGFLTDLGFPMEIEGNINIDNARSILRKRINELKF